MTAPLFAAYMLWAGWGISWFVAAFWANRTIARPAAIREWRYRIFTVSGFAGLLGRFVRIGPGGGAPWMPWPFLPLWRLSTPAEWAMVSGVATGAVFAWWARLHLGRLWSASLTRKTDHKVIDSGPYAIVRHPIYTGLILAAVATLAIRATPACALGLVLFVVGYTIKAREEERFLSGELGADAYAGYRARVPMLIPFGPH